MLKVGITGGIGSGKSLVCNVFDLFGVPVYNSDEEAKKIMNTDEEVRRKIINLFGEQSYDKTGLNRAYLRNKLFKEKQLLEKMNEIVHPAVRRYFQNWCEMHQSNPFVIQEAAIIFESGANKFLDYVSVVYAPEKIRIQRTVNRDVTNEQSVKNIIKNQMPEKEKLTLADDIIHNYDPHLVLPQILDLHKKLVRLSGN
jgi:dephospho-CoA kinase